jgi:hypothetical protein
VLDKLLILRKSLQLKLAHYAHCVSYAHARESLLKCETVISQAFFSLIGRQLSDLDEAQLYLPLWGCGAEPADSR